MSFSTPDHRSGRSNRQTRGGRQTPSRVPVAVAVVVTVVMALAAPVAARDKKPTKATTATADRSVEMAADGGYDAVAELGSLYNVVDQIGARELWSAGITGAGIDVAVIDTGVAPVPALTGADKVVAMVDLTSEAAIPEARYLDTNGHGSHMAGIIAGRDPGPIRRPERSGRMTSSASPPEPASSASRSATTPERSTSPR